MIFTLLRLFPAHYLTPWLLRIGGVLGWMVVACLAVGCSAASSTRLLPPSRLVMPESLVDFSLEQVNVTLDKADALEQLQFWLKDDALPSRAVVHCSKGPHHGICAKATALLSHYHVPFTTVASEAASFGREATGAVMLEFEKVVSRDCTDEQQRYAFGCAVAVNTLHMVHPRKQVMRPAILPYHSAALLLATDEDPLE